jgi:Tol biopolymer transport system component
MSVDVSPNGKMIVFDLLGDLYTLLIGGGKATRLTSGMAFDAQPRFRPDGKRVVFVADRIGGDNVWIVNLDAKDTVQLTKGNNSLFLSPAWTSDGKYVIASKSGRSVVPRSSGCITSTAAPAQLIKEPTQPERPRYSHRYSHSYSHTRCRYAKRNTA